MLGTLVNTVAVIVGATIGLLFKKNMSERLKSIYFQAIGLFTLAIGVTMIINMEHILIVVASLAIGSLIGEGLDIESKTENISEKLKFRFNLKNDKFTEGFVTSFLLFCVGSMTILGVIKEGLENDHDLLFTKSLMDFFSAILLASALGVGVVFSALPLLIFQGGLTLIAIYASNYLNDTVVHGITSIGGIMLIGLGINILEIKKLQIINMLPALFVVVVLLLIFT